MQDSIHKGPHTIGNLIAVTLFQRAMKFNNMGIRISEWNGLGIVVDVFNHFINIVVVLATY